MSVIPAQVDHRIPAADGYSLAASHFDASPTDTVVLINSATAVPRQFYERLASYFQSRGWSAVTYDYRGIGESKPRSLRGFNATMRDWALLDMTAVVNWVDRELSPERLFAIGHSFGGQALGMIGNVTRRHIRPADYGLERLQHVGFFRDDSEPLWREVIEWL